MTRREYVRTTSVLGSFSLAGCTDLSSNPNVTLAEPDRQFESSDVPYPAWGERIPNVTVPAPLDDRSVAIREIQTPSLLTFFYSSCQTVCPLLVSALGRIQTHARTHQYADQVEFLPITFDPERDNVQQLQAYGNRMNVEPAAGNWHFLRPRSTARAKQIIETQFGVVFQRRTPTSTPDYQRTETAEYGADGHGHGEYGFVHTPLVMLVNSDAYVERAYRTKSPDFVQIIDDLKVVRGA